MPEQSDTHQTTPPATPEILHYRGPLDPQFPPLRNGDILASGFGMTVAVWITTYICRLPFVHASGQFTVTAMLLVIAAAGFLAARYSNKGLRAALAAGALSGLLDILIIGSLIHDYTTAHQQGGQALVPSSALWIAGSILLNTLIAGIGGGLGHFLPSNRRNQISWPSLFTLVLAAATLPLISIGGLVTAFHAGLAVPDWPQSYGYNMFLFPLSLMQKNEGNFYEHSHRLMGALVGTTCLALAIYQSLAAKRPWQIALPWIIGSGIILQAILGGTRVTEKSITLAITHGVFAQLVFASMGVMAAVTSRKFLTLLPTSNPTASTDRALTTTLVLAIILQLILGAILRHTNELLMLHISMATLVTLLALACGIRAWGLHANHPPILKAGLCLMTLIVLQITLGLTALALRPAQGDQPTIASALITTTHQANGALLLLTAAVLMTWTYRLLTPTPATPAPTPIAMSI